MLTLTLICSLSVIAEKPTIKEMEIALAMSLRANTKRLWQSPIDHPEGMFKYSRGEHTQSIFTSGNTRVLNKVSIRVLDRKWVNSGGLKDLSGWVSEKYKYIPEGKEVVTWLGKKEVKNNLGFMQEELGINRSYPDGTRFDDVLINRQTGEVFEHRVAEKSNGKWKREVVYENRNVRPVGYTGLGQSCASCHREAGTGAYGQGLVPGGDTIISDPLDFSVWPTENKNLEINNLWQWTDEDGGYWWKWKEKKESKPLEDIFPKNEFSRPFDIFSRSSQPSISTPMFSQPTFQQTIFQPATQHCPT